MFELDFNASRQFRGPSPNSGSDVMANLPHAANYVKGILPISAKYRQSDLANSGKYNGLNGPD
jgi:hypothetical protein